MTSRALLLGLLLVAASSALAEQRGPSISPSPPLAAERGPDPRALEPAPTRIMVGDRAPDFSYIATDGRWRRIGDLLAQGAVLLVFGARDEDLMALERSRAAFLALGVIPAAVVDMRSSSAAALGRRLRLSYALVSDPKQAIANLYNSLDPVSARHAPSFFVLERNRTVRALHHGALPQASRMLTLSARSLGRALPGEARTTSGR